MRSFWQSIVFHPVRVRIAYDALAAFSAFTATWLIFFAFSQPRPQPVLSIIFFVIFVAAGKSLGIYDNLRLASLTLKILSLIGAVAFTVLVLFLMGAPVFFILLASFTTIMATVIPRATYAFIFDARKHYLSHSLNREHLPVLVVGGGGYIGSHIVEQLLQEGLRVRVFDTFQYGKGVLQDLFPNPRLELLEGDVSDIYKLTLAMQGVRDVIHLAGIVGDPACAVDPALTRHVNIVSTRLLKESAKASGIGRFIFASSCSVYGASSQPVDENSPLHPVSLYAQTKIDSEAELLHDTHDSFHPTVLRFATVFGHSRKPRFDLVANLFVAQAYNDGVINLTGENQWRPFIHVRDLARAVVIVIKSPQHLVTRQIFNVGDDSLNLQIGALAKIVQKIVGVSKNKKTVRIRNRPDPADPRNYFVSFKKIRRSFGYSATTSVESGLKEILVNWQKKTYTHHYKHSYYSNLESTKILSHLFYNPSYQSTHISILNEARRMDKARKSRL